MPLRLEAAILSRIRSAVTSRSNCANESSTLSVSRPIEVVVLNPCVTATKDTLCAKSAEVKAGLFRVCSAPAGFLIFTVRRGLSLLPPKPFWPVREKISDQGDCSARVNHSLPRITSISDASRATSRVLTQLWQSGMHKQQLVADLRYV
jgi:hypothetical protein